MSQFDDQQIITARAMFIGQRIDIRAFEKLNTIANNPLCISAGSNGLAVLFRYGVVVFFNLTTTEILNFIEEIKHIAVDLFSEPESEEIELFVSKSEPEGAELERIRLHGYEVQRLQTVAEVLAKSVVLAHYETYLNRHFDQIEPLAARLGKRHTIGKKGKELLLHIGEVLVIEGKMIGRVEAAEKPDLIWDYPEYERLYLRLEDEFDLMERQKALERKLSLISRTAETLLEILHGQRSLRVEWYIVILIVVEIVITLAEKIF